MQFTKMQAWINKIIKNLDKLILNLDKMSQEDMKEYILNNYRFINLITNILDKKTKLEGFVFKKDREE